MFLKPTVTESTPIFNRHTDPVPETWLKNWYLLVRHSTIFWYKLTQLG